MVSLLAKFEASLEDNQVASQIKALQPKVDEALITLRVRRMEYAFGRNMIKTMKARALCRLCFQMVSGILRYC